jgi:hypothetical protein
MANQPLGFQQENNGMLPFGKQQEILPSISTTHPEELSGSRWDTVH